jgi:hypothetical protein
MAPRKNTPKKIAVPVLPGATKTMEGRLLLSDLFPGDRYEGTRNQIITEGKITQGKRTLFVQTQREGADHRIVALAAVARDPGLTQTYLDSVQDYIPTSASGSRARELQQLWRIYRVEGVINNAVNKIAAILSGGGRFRVRMVRKGKRQNALEQLQAALDAFRDGVNNSPEDGVVKGDRGLQMVIHQAVRSCLVEGDWIARTVWTNHQVGSFGTFSMPMVIQSIPMEEIETPQGLEGIELFYWKPPSKLVDQLKRPETKEMKDYLKKSVPNDIARTLIKDGRVLLDPALCLHIKHRGASNQTFGESFITPAKRALAFKESVERLDFVSMSSLINRITIVMVGSSDPSSPYSKADVALARTNLMKQLFDEADGPNITMVWEGDDVKVESVGAHEEVLDLTDRHRLAMEKVKISLGVPDALLSGTASDGKSAGWAAVIGSSAQLEELQNAFSGIMTTLGERIALENGFTDVELVFEFDKSLLVDRAEEQNQSRNDYTSGLLSIRTTLLKRGVDPDAEYFRMCEEKGLTPGTATWQDAFMPPEGLQGQGPGKVPGNGRTPKSETGAPADSPTLK